MVSAKGAEFLGLTVGEFLGRVSAPTPAPAGGSVGALGVALAAALCVKAARLSARHSPDADELATRAGDLRARAAALCEADALIYGDVVAARREGDDVARALSLASNVPLEVCVVAADVAGIAARLAAEGNLALVGDVVVAAELAAAGARSAAALVALNLADHSDDRIGRTADLARAAGLAATDARRRLVQG